MHTYLVLCVSAYLWQVGSPCEVLPGRPYSIVPQYLALCLPGIEEQCHTGLLASSSSCSSVLPFILTSCWWSPLTNIFLSKKTGLYFWLSGMCTPELANLQNNTCFPFRGFWVPPDFHTQFILTPDLAIKKIIWMLDVAWGRKTLFIVMCLEGPAVLKTVDCSVKVIYLCAGMMLDIHGETAVNGIL